jgi:hypothetical protein
MTNEDQEDCVVARCTCKRIVFCAVTHRVMDDEHYREVGKLIRSGCNIEHVTVEAVRNEKWGCRCEP